MVGNLVVEIEIFNFCLFVCLLVCLYLTFCQFRKIVEIAIYNFGLFHSALMYVPLNEDLKIMKGYVAKERGLQQKELP